MERVGGQDGWSTDLREFMWFEVDRISTKDSYFGKVEERRIGEDG